MRRPKPAIMAEAEKATAKYTGKPVFGRVLTPAWFLCAIWLNADVDFGAADAVASAPSPNTVSEVSTGPLVWDSTLFAVFEVNLPLIKKYPTARAANTRPTVISLTHLLLSSMSAILS